MRILAFLPILLLTACATTNPYSLTVDDYVAAAPQITLGMTPIQVAQILAPTQTRLKNDEQRRPERYLKNGATIDIHYYRSGWQSDGLNTDDEFTPYLFRDNRLVSVGWQTLRTTAYKHLANIHVIGAVIEEESTIVEF